MYMLSGKNKLNTDKYNKRATI